MGTPIGTKNVSIFFKPPNIPESILNATIIENKERLKRPIKKINSTIKIKTYISVLLVEKKRSAANMVKKSMSIARELFNIFSK